MSSSDNNNNTSPIPQEDEQQQVSSPQQKQAEVTAKPNKQKEVSWAKKSNLNTRSAGIDMMKQALVEDISIDHSKTAFFNLPQAPQHITQDDLITTGTNDFASTISSLTEFFETNALLNDKKFYLDGTNIHGSYRNTDLCANSRFSCYLYRTVDNEIAFYLTRVDGCGIAFARLFNALNQSLGSNKERQIATFEAPPLLNTLQINTLEASYSNLSQSNQDSCVFAHGITSPFTWSLETLNNICGSIFRLHQKVATTGCGNAMCDIIIPSDEIIIPTEDDDSPIELPLPPKAQAHMITQSFDMLNASLSAITNPAQWAQQEPCNFSALTKFTEGLFAQQDNCYTHIAALLNHLSLDVKIATLQFLCLVLPSRPDLIPSLPNELLSALLDESAEVVKFNTCQPFEFISYQTMLGKIEELQSICFGQ